MANIVHSKKYLTKDLTSFTKAKEISGNNLKALRTLSFFLGECHVERRCYPVKIGILGEKRNLSAPNWSGTFHLLISTLDVLPVSCGRLGSDKAV